jgi:S-adenosylmethionine:tRNA ribosyltransferase-isomerase
VTGQGSRGRRILTFNRDISRVLENGYAPLPPYIKRKPEEARRFREFDLERYQTVYSSRPGSIAAPTAGLHFTSQILDRIKQRNPVLEIELKVGEATFQKIESDHIEEHRMGREAVSISPRVRSEIESLKKKGHLVAVGTTSVRALETLAREQPESETFESELFIYPGFEFRMVDKLITNFHLPESSLFILVSAFAGRELMQKAYRIAVEQKYRFFSYGDAMFIV